MFALEARAIFQRCHINPVIHLYEPIESCRTSTAVPSAMTTPTSTPSIRDLAPLETGGRRAREGFLFQDHVAAGFLIEMLERSELEEVWCEAHDDITLLWSRDAPEVEFVQVKSEISDQLWSLSRVCKRDGSRVGTSVYEKSLANDREMIEHRSFRLVLAQGVVRPLRRFHAPEQAPDADRDLSTLGRVLGKWPLAGVRSPAGNGADYWLARLRIDVGELIAVQNQNRVRLYGHALGTGAFLMPDQLDQCYLRLVGLAADAATRRRSVSEPERLTRTQVIAFVEDLYETIDVGSRRSPAAKLREKLHEAGLPEGDIIGAEDLRKRYRLQSLDRAFLDLRPAARDVPDDVRARLNELRSELYSASSPETGIEFHTRCLHAMADLHSRASGTAPSVAFYQGAMYEQTERCVHRFVRA